VARTGTASESPAPGAEACIDLRADWASASASSSRPAARAIRARRISVVPSGQGLSVAWRTAVAARSSASVIRPESHLATPSATITATTIAPRLVLGSARMLPAS